ncbi:polysaccharide pyruvyl transferase family protein [Microbacterium sp. CFH 90308]|uniref:Polysaccharide pyruvyl transferase family protein n=1 Tax=Microbacterium salsuginis TaxID=2722803 RepID=A0ABX1KEA8_9MICO|nr:polysaccharide pyruvyl transferase family protein [Microbacterium sp. CFH 90308]NLP84323.1 polysaccharide pyruvyl transferase family protein [Microbacterium sp. CFH 90308]
MRSPEVETVHWNPRIPVVAGRIGKFVPIRRRAQNFGDLLGPIVVEGLRPQVPPPARRRLVAVGSILHLAEDGDVVWGTGRNGKIPVDRHTFHSLDVRAVRGPLTRDFLLGRGIEVPETYGDPGLLIPFVMPELSQPRVRSGVTVIMNFNDARERSVPGSNIPSQIRVLSARSPVKTCLRAISESEFVIGSSLHAIVVADALGIPARLVRSSREPLFKYEDYFSGTRRDLSFAATIGDALRMGPHEPLTFDLSELLDSFPRDLWTLDG